MEEKAKRVVQIEIDDQVKKLTIEGVDKDAQVVMKQELSVKSWITWQEGMDN